jgi:TM2 domain-containing membrane protein YozV
MKVILYIFFLGLTPSLFSENKVTIPHHINSIIDSSEVLVLSVDSKGVTLQFNFFKEAKKPNPIFQLFKKKQKLNKKITAAVLAFPFPFGIVGLHRIYLGTKPYVPVAYIASLGGVFGILPFIDFCMITFNKDFDHYRENGKVFMWIKD